MISVLAASFRADGLAALVPAGAWQRLSCADGSKGPRLYDWALIETVAAGHWLLVTTLAELVTMATPPPDHRPAMPLCPQSRNLILLL